MKREGLTVAVILLFMCLALSPSIFAIEDNKKSIQLTNGNILYVGGSGPNNYTQIQDAVFDASDGDIVFVYSGVYYEDVIVNKAIRLIGEDKNTTVIDADFEGIPLDIYADGLFVTGFTIQHCRDVANDWDSCNVKIRYSQNVTVTDNIINIGRGHEVGNYFPCVLIWNSTDITISNNYIFENDWIHRSRGITIIEESTDISIVNNVITGYHFGIETISGYRIAITNNSIYNNGLGMDIKSDEVVISDNIIVDSKYHGIWTYYMENSVISGNIIANNSNCGVEMWTWEYGGNNLIHGNEIRNNGICGLLIYHSALNTVTNNNFINNGDGIKNYILGEGNAFFSDNTRRIAYNTWDGNYWDDSASDGKYPYAVYGNKLFILMWHKWINIDWHPATEPYDIGGNRL